MLGATVGAAIGAIVGGVGAYLIARRLELRRGDRITKEEHGILKHVKEGRYSRRGHDALYDHCVKNMGLSSQQTTAVLTDLIRYNDARIIPGPPSAEHYYEITKQGERTLRLKKRRIL